MNRRGFLGMMVGGIAVAAAEPTWPFRVFSFPTSPIAVTIAEYNNYVNFPEFALASMEFWTPQGSYRVGQIIRDHDNSPLTCVLIGNTNEGVL